jgi:hypothetical protein
VRTNAKDHRSDLTTRHEDGGLDPAIRDGTGDSTRFFARLVEPAPAACTASCATCWFGHARACLSPPVISRTRLDDP